MDLFTPQVHDKENNRESLAILNDNKQRFSNHCRIVLDALLRGERLTTGIALTKYSIGDLRARCRDLDKFNGIKIEKQLIEGRYKEYFLSQEEINRIKANN